MSNQSKKAYPGDYPYIVWCPLESCDKQFTVMESHLSKCFLDEKPISCPHCSSEIKLDYEPTDMLNPGDDDILGGYYMFSLLPSKAENKKPIGYPPLSPSKGSKMFVQFYDVIKNQPVFVNKTDISSIEKVSPTSSGVVCIVRLRSGVTYNLSDTMEDVVSKIGE